MESLDLVDRSSTSSSRPCVILLPDAGLVSSVLLSRSEFERDVSSSFRGQEDARRQVDVDAPRCRIEYEGLRVLDAASVPSRFHPLCTQAVVGLAVQLLHDASGLVAEPHPSSALRICVERGGDFVVQKKLRTGEVPPGGECEEEEWTDVTVVVVGVGDGVTIHYVRG